MAPDQPAPEHFADQLNLSDYIDLLRRRWLVVVATALVVALVAVAYTLVGGPRVEPAIPAPASGETVEVPVAVLPLRQGETQQVVPPDLVAESRLVSSDAVATMVRSELGGSISIEELLGGLTVSPIEGSLALAIRHSAADADTAEARALSFARNYLHYRYEGFRRATARLRDQLLNRLRIARRQIARAPSESVRTALVIRMFTLEDTLAGVPEARRREVGYVVGTAPVSAPAPTASPAVSTVETSQPGSSRRNGLAGLLLGLLLGIGIALIQESLDDRMRDPRHVERLLKRPVVGRLSRDDGGRSATSCAASLNTLIARHGRDLLIVSPTEEEHAPQALENVAAAMNELDGRVLLMSAGSGSEHAVEGAKFDAVLWETNPVSESSEAYVVGTRVSNAVIVIRENVTRQHTAQQAVEELELAGITVLGALLVASS